MSNRKKLRRPRLICPDCAAGRHPPGPHCAFCGAVLVSGEHPAPVCEMAAAVLLGHGIN